MSYCRWSSDNFSCDIYCYDHGGGFTIHVAGNRVIGDIPKLPPFPTDPGDDKAINAYVAAHQMQMEFLRLCQREDIELPYAGETLQVDSAEDCVRKLLELREIGYRVPQYAIDEILSEITSDAT